MKKSDTCSTSSARQGAVERPGGRASLVSIRRDDLGGQLLRRSKAGVRRVQDYERKDADERIVRRLLAAFVRERLSFEESHDLAQSDECMDVSEDLEVGLYSFTLQPSLLYIR